MNSSAILSSVSSLSRGMVQNHARDIGIQSQAGAIQRTRSAGRTRKGARLSTSPDMVSSSRDGCTTLVFATGSRSVMSKNVHFLSIVPSRSSVRQSLLTKPPAFTIVSCAYGSTANWGPLPRLKETSRRSGAARKAWTRENSGCRHMPPRVSFRRSENSPISVSTCRVTNSRSRLYAGRITKQYPVREIRGLVKCGTVEREPQRTAGASQPIVDASFHNVHHGLAPLAVEHEVEIVPKSRHRESDVAPHLADFEKEQSECRPFSKGSLCILDEDYGNDFGWEV
ncbi:hypothetical protein B0H15DRAFT_863376 [Mycena belliarum]|uniref:Uncharacterized protein n=1 Tax=Mycena belliarum TaxID=1033014 RepID=A0AAD6XG42_9AGAR|nr:hypothetical protein B0H15DRAFT_863376 [Mycena belliae]